MEKKTLEEIFWRDRKFVKKNGKKVNPKPIGEPISIGLYYSEETKEQRIQEKIYSELLEIGDNQINAFSKGEISRGSEEFSHHYCFPTQFYKI